MDDKTQKALDLFQGAEPISLSENKYPEKNQWIPKGWAPLQAFGRVGEVFAYHKKDERSEHRLKVDTVKILYFEKDKQCSLHFHREKDEFFVCAFGKFSIEVVEDGVTHKHILSIGHRLFIPNCTPHRIIGLNDLNILVEVSTEDEPSDSYRIEKGD